MSVVEINCATGAQVERPLTAAESEQAILDLAAAVDLVMQPPLEERIVAAVTAGTLAAVPAADPAAIEQATQRALSPDPPP